MTEEDRLRELFRADGVSDAGFTLRVLTALPRRRRRARVRLAVLLTASMVGALVSLVLFGAGTWLTEGLQAVVTEPRRHWPALFGAVILAATVLLAALDAHESE